jgi:hypothetical protein
MSASTFSIAGRSRDMRGDPGHRGPQPVGEQVEHPPLVHGQLLGGEHLLDPA